MSWEVADRAEKRLKEIALAVKGADHLYLATDPDREGEAISWHVQEVLRQRKALAGVDVKRVVFNEVTKAAVLDAFRHPREINKELVDAYLARRAQFYRCLSREETGPPAPARPLHHLDPAAGSLAQARPRRPAHHAHGPTAL